MSHLFGSEILPITIHEDGLQFDPTVFVVDHETHFKTRMLRNFYLNSLTVFPKTVYKTYWIDDHYNSLAKLGIKVKATLIFPDIIGIEYAKTKTIVSKDSVRVIECINGTGVVVIQPDSSSITEEIVPHLIEMFPGTKVLIPPGWIYTLVNIGREAFATIEMIHKDNQLHIAYKKQRGASLYLIERNGTVEIVKNSRYKNVQKYVKLDPNGYLKKFSIKESPTIIHQVCENGKCFEWVLANGENWQSTLHGAAIGDPYTFSD